MGWRVSAPTIFGLNQAVPGERGEVCPNGAL